MGIKLKKQDQEFRNPVIFYGDAKTLEIDRVLLNLFMLIKFGGSRPKTRIGTKEVTINNIVEKLISKQSEGKVNGFAENQNAVYLWALSNLTDLVYRGNIEKEKLASLKAIHINSYKYRNAASARDYFFSEQVFSMLSEAPDLVKQLEKFLSKGWDQMTGGIAKGIDVDLDTLGILRVVEDIKDDRSIDNQFKPNKPLCIGQARIFCDDLRRLMAYQNEIPRPVLLEYFKTIMSLHLSLYIFKLFKILPGWISNGCKHEACINCSVNGQSSEPFKNCPYHNEFVVDCGDDPDSLIAQIALEDAAYYNARIQDYLKSTFEINMAKQFNDTKNFGRKSATELDDALKAISQKGIEWDVYFKMRVQSLIQEKAENSTDTEDDSMDFKSIIDMNLPPFETFIEIIMQARSAFHYKYHRQMLDSLLQKNKDTGLLWAGRSLRYPRRFWMGSRMLETLIQLAVLVPEHNGFSSKPILIEEYLDWMLNRYGIIVNGIGMQRFEQAGISVHTAFRDNLTSLKAKLRETGFFNVLSDAYIMQRIRPRYEIKR